MALHQPRNLILVCCILSRATAKERKTERDGEKETMENGRINGGRVSDENERGEQKWRREKKTKKRLAEDKERHVEEGGDEEKRSKGRLCGRKNNSYPLFCGFHSTSMFRV